MNLTITVLRILHLLTTTHLTQPHLGIRQTHPVLWGHLHRRHQEQVILHMDKLHPLLAVIKVINYLIYNYWCITNFCVSCNIIQKGNMPLPFRYIKVVLNGKQRINNHVIFNFDKYNLTKILDSFLNIWH